MVSSKNPAPAIRRNQGPDILLTLRESLIEESQASRLKRGRACDPARRDSETARKDYRAPIITVAEPSTDAAPLQNLQPDETAADDSAAVAPVDNSLDQNSRQSSFQIDGMTSESPTIAPAEHSLDVDPRQTSLKPDRSTGDDNAKIALAAHLTGQNRQQPSTQSDRFAGDKPSVRQRAFRTVARGLVLVAIVGGAFTLLSYENDGKRDIVKAWNLLSQLWLLAAPGTNPTRGITTAAVSRPSPQPPIQLTVVPLAAPGIQPAAAVATGSSSSSPQEIETLVKDLGMVRRLVEDLVAKQDQLAQDIATLQAAEANVSEKIASLSQSATVHIRPRKRALRKPPQLGQ
jgi:hypothetical protein